MSVIGLRTALAAAATKPAATEGSTERKPSQFWLNIGVTLPGAGENGEDLFVSLPVGIPLDDMKPVAIKGNNQNWINLAQTKNTLLEEVQKAGASMEPGSSDIIEGLSVQILRVGGAKPSTGDAESNPLIAALIGTLGKKS